MTNANTARNNLDNPTLENLILEATLQANMLEDQANAAECTLRSLQGSPNEQAFGDARSTSPAGPSPSPNGSLPRLAHELERMSRANTRLSLALATLQSRIDAPQPFTQVEKREGLNISRAIDPLANAIG